MSKESENPKPQVRETTKGERGSFGVGGGRRGSVVANLLREGTPHRSNQKTKRKREALVKNPVLSFFFFYFFSKLCYVWDILACHYYVTIMFGMCPNYKKKGTRWVQILVLSYQN